MVTSVGASVWDVRIAEHTVHSGGRCPHGAANAVCCVLTELAAKVMQSVIFGAVPSRRKWACWLV